MPIYFVIQTTLKPYAKTVMPIIPNAPTSNVDKRSDNVLMSATQIWHATGYLIIDDPDKQDPRYTQLRFTAQGNPYVRFTICVYRGESNKVDFFPCYAWQYAAEYISKHGKDRSFVSVLGQWQQTKVHLDDKTCPHCKKVLKPRLRDWYKLNVFKIQIHRQDHSKYGATGRSGGGDASELVDPFSSDRES